MKSCCTIEEIVVDFANMILDIDNKPCDEIENEIQRIVHRTRGLIHKDLR
jgi:hypothetical protein